MSISILAIGSELLDGRVQDTNSQFIAQELNKVGLLLDKVIICDDIETEIINALEYLSRTSKHIIVSGGLGPTTDDLTREAIARFMAAPLRKDSEAIKRLEKLYLERKRKLDSANEKQAFFPDGAYIILNPVGTAEGFHIQNDTIHIFSVPGVPKELKPMFFDSILPEILKGYPSRTALYRSSFRIFGLPESLIGSRVHSLKLSDDYIISYRATFPEIHVIIKHVDQSSLNKIQDSVNTAIGNEFIFAKNESTSFPEAVSVLLAEKNISISVAESCTGGMLGMYLSSIPGSSKFFLGGVMSYSNSIKKTILHISDDILENNGAVSQETACEMAQGCRELTGSHYSLSITGIAGPDGGSIEKPVGTFYVGISNQQQTVAYRFFFKSDRHAVRRFACYSALDVLRRTILNIPVWDYSAQEIAAILSDKSRV